MPKRTDHPLCSSTFSVKRESVFTQDCQTSKVMHLVWSLPRYEGRVPKLLEIGMKRLALSTFQEVA
jgi:hypothetical protein